MSWPAVEPTLPHFGAKPSLSCIFSQFPLFPADFRFPSCGFAIPLECSSGNRANYGNGSDPASLSTGFYKFPLFLGIVPLQSSGNRGNCGSGRGPVFLWARCFVGETLTASMPAAGPAFLLMPTGLSKSCCWLLPSIPFAPSSAHDATYDAYALACCLQAACEGGKQKHPNHTVGPESPSKG